MLCVRLLRSWVSRVSDHEQLNDDLGIDPKFGLSNLRSNPNFRKPIDFNKF